MGTAISQEDLFPFQLRAAWVLLGEQSGEDNQERPGPSWEVGWGH